MYRDYHPYLTHAYLTRSPINQCLRCGKRLGNIAPGGRWRYACWQEHHKRTMLGYVHDWQCAGNNNNSDYEAVG